MKILKFLTLTFALASTALAQETEKKVAETKAATFSAAEKSFTVPAEWKKEKPSSPMRKAQLKTGDTEIVVFHFGKGQGGGAEANIARWLKQFEEATDQKTTDEKVGESKTKITTVTAKGTYLSGPPLGAKTPKKGYALRGAIVELEAGPVFIKMTGPEKEVEKAAKAFDKMVRSAFKK